MNKISGIRFEVFSKNVKQITVQNNITFIPLDGKAFNKSMINCTGVLTGAGFETPAEALYMNKKLMCLPIKGQYEQLCNAEALKEFNVPIISSIDNQFSSVIDSWLNGEPQKKLLLNQSTEQIVSKVINSALSLRNGINLQTEYSFIQPSFQY